MAMVDVVILNDIPSISNLSRGIGAYRLATELENHGYKTFVIDYASCMSADKFENIISKVLNENTRVFAVSSTWMREDSIFTSQFIRKLLNKYSPECKLVVGGAYAYRYIDDDYDHIFIGHSENQIIDFMNSISYPRIIDWDRKAQSGKFDFNKSITTFLDYAVLDADEIVGLETSRGCIFNCAFCNYQHRGQNTRNFMKCEDVLYKELMNNYEKWGITRYAIIDDTFNDYTDKLIRIKSVIDRLPFKPMFWAYIRFDLIEAHPEQAQLLYDIGIRSAMHGLETWNDDTARIIKKGKRSSKINGMKIAKEVWKDEVFINVFYIAGLPEDTIDDAYDFILYWKTEGYKYIDSVTAFPLWLRDLHGNEQKYSEQSDIEKYKEKYGYKMIGSKKWIRTGKGDIDTFEKAANIAELIRDKCKSKYINDNLWSWHVYADRLNIQDRVKATQKFFDEIYYPNLLRAANEL